MSDLTHLQHIRQEMPATTSRIYMNAGTFGPLPACVVSAMQERMQQEWQNGRLGASGFEAMFAIYDNARKGVAHLLNADADEIALTDNTGEGLNIISYGIDWHEGDEAITTNHEHISLLAPLYQLRDRYGIVIRVADIGEKGDLPILKPIADLVTPRTSLISLSHVSWMMGALDMHALNVDYYAIPIQKWLCGPDGTGALYARHDSLGNIKNTYVGPFSIKHEMGKDWGWELLDKAQRFETGGRQTAALAGQVAVLNWLDQVVGHQWMYERIAALSTYAFHALQEIPGLHMLTPRAGASGLVSFRLEGKDDGEVVKYLNEKHNIYIRNIPSINALRVSTGFYNTEEEIDTLVRALREM